MFTFSNHTHPCAKITPHICRRVWSNGRMKRNTRQMAGMGLTLAAIFATAGTVVAKENAYDFRKRLAIVHEEGLRDVALRPAADEIELKNGLGLVVPAGEKGLVFRAAQDFQDYLAVSMGVAAIMLEKGTEGDATTKVEINHPSCYWWFYGTLPYEAVY